jgi:surface antigen
MQQSKGFVVGVGFAVLVLAAALVLSGVTTSRPGSTKTAGSVGVGYGGGDDYPYKDKAQDSGFDPWGEYYKECTSFVAWALHSRNGFDMPWSANAVDWGTKASGKFPVNDSPAVGSVAWTTAGPGHVAWVAAVGAGSVTVEEYNYHHGVFSTRTVATSTFRYIHFKDLPTAPLPAPAEQAAPAAPTPPQVHVDPPVPTHPLIVTNGNGDSASQATPAPVQSGANPAPATGNPQPAGGSTIQGSQGGNGGSPQPDPVVQPAPSTTAVVQPDPPPAAPPRTYGETAGGAAHTWTNPQNAGGYEGPTINGGQTVQIACKVDGFRVADGNTAWYKIAESPWNGTYFVSADAFYNNGATSGSLHGTPYVDPAVPYC